MKIVVDSDMQAVAEFMQDNIPASKLLLVANSLPNMARLLWSQYPQETYHIAVLEEPKRDQESPSPKDAI